MDDSFGAHSLISFVLRDFLSAFQSTAQFRATLLMLAFSTYGSVRLNLTRIGRNGQFKMAGSDLILTAVRVITHCPIKHAM